jgi:hypothetical protein
MSEEIGRDLDYERNNIGYDNQYPESDGGGIKCKNHIVCRSVLPLWWFECKGCYLCTECDMLFGTWTSGDEEHTGKGILTTKDELECSICLEVKKCISQPRCEHFVCIDCFRRCYYGNNSTEGMPVFPYPDMKDEYYDDMNNKKWENFPLIESYSEELNKWQDEKDTEDAREENLSKCPLCLR